MLNEVYGAPAATSGQFETLRDTSEKVDQALEMMFEREAHYAEKRLAAGEAEYAHKIKRAVMFKTTSGTVKEREMLADEMAATEMKERFIADAESDIAKEKLLDIRAAVSARQSILNSETRRMI